MKRCIRNALILVLSLCLLTGSVMAQTADEVSGPPADYRSGEIIATGTDGKNITWTVYDNGTLAFSGTGATKDYTAHLVGNWVNFDSDVEHVVFEEGITAIGEYFLYSLVHQTYDRVKTLTIPSTVTFIGEDAFTCMDGLEAVFITDLEQWCQIEFANSWSNPLDNQVALYLDGVPVEELVIPESVTVLKDYAFIGCSSLRSVTIHEDVTRIGSFALNSCYELKTVRFMGNAPEFGRHIFTLDKLTAFYPDKKAGWEEAIAMDLGGTVTWVPYGALPFTDVPVDSFYHDSVAWAVAKGITNGLTATEFGSEAACNRAQVVTFLWRAAGEPEPTTTENPFVDVEAGSFYGKAVLWAVEQGITNGTDETHFSPNAACNRATVVTFLHRAAGSPAAQSSVNPFTDVPADSWYTAPVLWAVEQGITNGMGGGLFGVDTVCNRAQIVTFLYRAYK